MQSSTEMILWLGFFHTTKISMGLFYLTQKRFVTLGHTTSLVARRTHRQLSAHGIACETCVLKRCAVKEGLKLTYAFDHMITAHCMIQLSHASRAVKLCH